MLDLIKKRRSIREFTNEKIGAEDYEKIMQAALLAPSSKNTKAIEFIVTEEKEILLGLAKCKNAGTKALDTAAMAVVIIGNGDKSDVWVADGAIAATNIMHMAEVLDLGGCWIQIHRRQGQKESAEKEVRTLLNIPDHYGVLAVMAIGHKNEQKEPYTNADADFTKVHRDRF